VEVLGSGCGELNPQKETFQSSISAGQGFLADSGTSLWLCLMCFKAVFAWLLLGHGGQIVVRRRLRS